MVSIMEENSGDLAHLVGPDGKVLDSLQELARLAATRETGERSRLMLDIAGHRAARRAELVTLAQQAVAEAQRTAAPVRLDPMTPFERKVVHDVVAESGLVSESEGDEPARRVVIRTA
jgi:spoIIIJ-associated protein